MNKKETTVIIKGKGLLNKNEELWDVALRNIGIMLTDEYVLRFIYLMEKAKTVGIEKISLSDSVDIEHEAHKEIERRREQEPAAHNVLFDLELKDFMLSIKTVNIMSCNQVRTIRDLVRLNRKDLLLFRPMSNKTLVELDEFMAKFNLSWGMDI